MATFNEIQALIQADDIPTVVSLLNYLRSSRPTLFTSVQADYLIKRLQKVNDGSITIDALKQELVDAMSTGTIADDASDESNTDTINTFIGFVYYDDAGVLTPLADSIVQIGNDVTITDATGYFNIIPSSVVTTSSVKMTLSADGYISKTNNIQITSDNMNLGNSILYPKSLAGSYSGDAAGSIVLSSTGGNTATLEIIANGVVDSTGTIYTGNINVYGKLLVPTESTFFNELPGDLESSTATLVSYGIVLVELQDDAGNKLSLNGTDAATITIPAIDVDNALDTISLWYFDEYTGMWVEEGTATLNTTDETYVCDIMHLSFWNCSAAFDKTLVEFALTSTDASVINQQLNAIATFIDSVSGKTLNKVSIIGSSTQKYMPVNQEITVTLIDGTVIGTISALTASADVQTVTLDNITCVTYDATFILKDEAGELVTDDTELIFKNGLDGFTNDGSGTYVKNISVVETIDPQIYIGSIIKIINDVFIGTINLNDISIDSANNHLDLGTITLSPNIETPQYTIKDSSGNIIYKTLMIPVGDSDETNVDGSLNFINDQTQPTRTAINIINDVNFDEWAVPVTIVDPIPQAIPLAFTIMNDDETSVELFNLNSVGSITVPAINTINTSAQSYSPSLYGFVVPADQEFTVNVLKLPYTQTHANGTIIQHVKFDVTYNNGTQNVTIEVRI